MDALEVSQKEGGKRCACTGESYKDQATPAAAKLTRRRSVSCTKINPAQMEHGYREHVDENETCAVSRVREGGMRTEQKPTNKGEQAASGLREAAAKDEMKTEEKLGHDLAKGPDRFDELSKSSDGRSAAIKQKG
jgi:hypothetical protein